jgi:para-aminobenzoate synthetase component I
MTSFDRVVAGRPQSTPADPPATPPTCRGHLREIDRWEWFAGDPGDPTDRLEEFLAGFGLPVRDLAAPVGQGRHPVGRGAHRVCGAAVLVSAQISAALAGAACPASPAPAVPDVVAVVYAPDHRRRSPPAQASAATAVGPWQPTWTPAEHAAAVSAVQRAIGCGDVYQVNLVGHAAAAYTGDPVPAFNRVAGLAGARYGGVLRGSGWAVASASPETLVEVTGGSEDTGAVVRTRPIKGTRPATRTGREQLLASPKERAEHIMIVDLERNDLGRIARTGTVRVERLYDLVRWAGLWQAESQIAADLVPGIGLAALLRASCPGGSVTGAPKLAALDVIAALEPVGRGPAMGALGWVGPDGVDLGLTIRTVAADADRFHLWAGGGITWSSAPDAEVAEAAAKAAPIRAALRSG